MSYLQFNWESQYLGNSQTVSVIMPDRPKTMGAKDFYNSGEKYKVLWLLHGTFGDHYDWVRKSMLEIYARERGLICVMPSGLNSNYANWPTAMMGYNMYDYMFEELMPLIHNWLPASDKREDNYIAGLSMGGGGAQLYAYNHPEKFIGLGCLSSPPFNYDNLSDDPADMNCPENPRFKNILANAGGLDKFLESYENVYRMIPQRMADGTAPEKIYYCCGTADRLYPQYTAFKQMAQEKGWNMGFHEIEGLAHEWRFWNAEIELMLDFFGIPKLSEKKKSNFN